MLNVEEQNYCDRGWRRAWLLFVWRPYLWHWYQSVSSFSFVYFSEFNDAQVRDIYQNIMIFVWTSVNIRYSELEGAEYIRPIVATSGWSFHSFFWQEPVCFWWIYRCPKSIQWPLYAWCWYVQYSLWNTLSSSIFLLLLYCCLFV